MPNRTDVRWYCWVPTAVVPNFVASRTPHRSLLVPVAATVVVLAVGALLVGILLVLVSTRDELGRQRELSAQILSRATPTFSEVPGAAEAARPVLRDAAPVFRLARTSLPQLRRTADVTEDLVADARPLVADLRAAGLPALTDAAGALVRDLGPAAADLRPAASALRAADLPRLLGDLGGLAGSGRAALPQLTRLLVEVRERALLRRASKAVTKVGRIAALQEDALRTNRETLRRTTAIEGMFRESLRIQREGVELVRSINEKVPDVNPGRR